MQARGSDVCNLTPTTINKRPALASMTPVFLLTICGFGQAVAPSVAVNSDSRREDVTLWHNHHHHHHHHHHFFKDTTPAPSDYVIYWHHHHHHHHHHNHHFKFNPITPTPSPTPIPPTTPPNINYIKIRIHYQENDIDYKYPETRVPGPSAPSINRMNGMEQQSRVLHTITLWRPSWKERKIVENLPIRAYIKQGLPENFDYDVGEKSKKNKGLKMYHTIY